MKSKISEYDSKIVNYNSEINKIQSEIVTIVSEFKSAANKLIEEFGTAKSKLENDAEKIKSDKLVLEQQISKEKQEFKITLDSNTNILNSECDKQVRDIDTQIEKNEIDIQTLVNDSKQALSAFVDINKRNAELKISSIKAEIDDLYKKKTDFCSEIRVKLGHLEIQAHKIREQQAQIDELASEITTLNVRIDTESKFNPSVTNSSIINSLTEAKKRDEIELISTKSVRDENAKILTVLTFWKSAFSDTGIKSMLIDVAIPHMNRCVREELDRVCPGTFTVSFDTLSQTKSGTIRDKFSINITHNLKCATGHKKLSGGEKRIIDFCCMSALRSLAESLYGKMFCHIFYDEVLDSLDSECRELFCRSMKTQSSDERHILLVTHALTEDVEPDRIFPF